MYTSWLLHMASLGFNVDLTEEKGRGLGLVIDNEGESSSSTSSEITYNNANELHGASKRKDYRQSENEEEEEDNYDNNEKDRPRKRRRNDVCQEVMQLLLFKKFLLPSPAMVIKGQSDDDDGSEEEFDPNLHDADTVVMSNHEPWMSDGENAEDLNMIKTPSCCSICMQDFDSDSKIVRSKCYKYYHRHCILEWMQSKNDSCPDCGSAIWDHIEFTVDVDQDVCCRGNPQESHDTPDLCDEASTSTIVEMDNFDEKKFDEENQMPPPTDIIVKEQQPWLSMALRKRRTINDKSRLTPPPPPCVFVNNVNKNRSSALAA